LFVWLTALGCFAYGVGLSLHSYRSLVFACGASFISCLPRALAFACFLVGLLASPLCGAALTFFAAEKKVSKESGLQPPAEPVRIFVCEAGL
jgi:hypothetical protein